MHLHCTQNLFAEQGRFRPKILCYNKPEAQPANSAKNPESKANLKAKIGENTETKLELLRNQIQIGPKLPDRSPDALEGSEVLTEYQKLKSDEQQTKFLLEQIAKGNVPDSCRKYQRYSKDGVEYLASVAPIRFGSNQNWVELPLSGTAAQAIADATGTTVPARWMVDGVYDDEIKNGKHIHQNSLFYNPKGKVYSPAEAIKVHNDQIQTEIKNGANPDSSAHFKYVVAPEHKSKIRIYGWLNESPQGVTMWQVGPVSHPYSYSDYSHNSKFFARVGYEGSKEKDLASTARYPYSKEIAEMVKQIQDQPKQTLQTLVVPPPPLEKQPVAAPPQPVAQTTPDKPQEVAPSQARADFRHELENNPDFQHRKNLGQYWLEYIKKYDSRARDEINAEIEEDLKKAEADEIHNLRGGWDKVKMSRMFLNQSTAEGMSFTVDLKNLDKFENHIGAGDILPPNVTEISVVDLQGVERTGTRKTVNGRTGYYDENGYIRVYSGYTITIRQTTDENSEEMKEAVTQEKEAHEKKKPTKVDNAIYDTKEISHLKGTENVEEKENIFQFGKERVYISTPKSLGGKKPRVVIYFHGNNGSIETSLKDKEIHAQVQRMRANDDPVILVIPENRLGGWKDFASMNAFRDLVGLIDDESQTTNTEISIATHSGGFQAVQNILREPAHHDEDDARVKDRIVRLGLLDSAYGTSNQSFINFAKRPGKELYSTYTLHLEDENKEMIQALGKEIREGRVHIKPTSVGHDAVPNHFFTAFVSESIQAQPEAQPVPTKKREVAPPGVINGDLLLLGDSILYSMGKKKIKTSGTEENASVGSKTSGWLHKQVEHLRDNQEIDYFVRFEQKMINGKLRPFPIFGKKPAGYNLDNFKESTAFVLIGTNDIGGATNPEKDSKKIWNNIQNTIGILKSKHITPILGTIPPHQGYESYDKNFEVINATRELVNTMIRNSGEKYVDLSDLLTRDENGNVVNPLALSKYYDSRDHLHPNGKLADVIQREVARLQEAPSSHPAPMPTSIPQGSFDLANYDKESGPVPAGYKGANLVKGALTKDVIRVANQLKDIKTNGLALDMSKPVGTRGEWINATINGKRYIFVTEVHQHLEDDQELRSNLAAAKTKNIDAVVANLKKPHRGVTVLACEDDFKSQ